MKISNTGIDLIKRHEGCRLEAYRCPAGVLTIGYGHTGNDVEEWSTITEIEADKLLRKDIIEAENAVSRLTKVPLSQSQFDSLVSFTFNLGEGNLSRSTLLRKVNRNAPLIEIQREFGKWIYANGRILTGLVRRREDEAKLYGSEG